jgi:hypothetical protein
MAPRGAPVRRGRRRGELGHLTTSPTASGCVKRWRMRRLAATTQSAGRPPHRAGGGRPCEDAGQTVRDTPAFGRLVVATVGWPGIAAVVPELPPGWLPRHLCCSPDEPITLPTATIFVDADEWGACAHSLGGASSALFAGLVARLANEWDGSPQTARSRLGDAGQRARRRTYSRQRLQRCLHHGGPCTGDDGPARDPGCSEASADWPAGSARRSVGNQVSRSPVA